MITRVAIEDGEQNTPSSGVNDSVDTRQSERVFRTVFVEVCVVNTHPPLIVVLLENQYRIRQTLGVIDFFDESSRE